MVPEETRDYYAGSLMIVVGLFAAGMGSQYEMGSLENVGPGFVPTVLGVALVIVGLAIACANKIRRSPDEAVDVLATPIDEDRPDWRAIGCVSLGVLSFAVFFVWFGLLPAIFSCVLISARGDRSATWISSILLAAGLSFFGILLFSFLLGIPMPIIRGFWT
jgi:Tripartite tricarboxylate transporter TctB family